MSSPNTGWLFYKKMYKYLYENDTRPDKLDNNRVESVNKEILKAKLVEYVYPNAKYGFELKTIYPGLVTGSGYSHNAKECTDNFDFGFFFDYTTGMPILSGSSVKGVLRSIFQLLKIEDKKDSVLLFFQDIFTEIGYEDTQTLTMEKLQEIENEIFKGVKVDGTRVCTYGRDKFFDTCISHGDSDNKILADDFITPHGENLLIEPVPNRMLKVKPDVKFRFSFDLHDGILSASHKEELFLLLLQFTGIGAKTNVGYGQFEEINIDEYREERNRNHTRVKIDNASGFEKLLLQVANMRSVDNNMRKIVKEYFDENDGCIDQKGALLNILEEKDPERKSKHFTKVVNILNDKCI